MLGFAAFSGVGNKTLMEHLPPSFCARNLRVGVIERSRPGLEVDRTRRDDNRLRRADAASILLVRPTGES